MGFKFTSGCWENLGEGIGKSKSLQTLSIVNCNISHGNNLELFMKGLGENDSLQKLDLSDNYIGDNESTSILRYIKMQAEKRENIIWMTGLRHS